MIAPERIRSLNDRPVAKGKVVLYWMQASQRARTNAALEYAIERANHLHQPLLTVFALTPRVPNANDRHYRFLLEGLCETQGALLERGIPLLVRMGDPVEVVHTLASKASLVMTDCGYLRFQRVWRDQLAQRLSCPLIEVEADAIVPLEHAYAKQAYSAAVLRPALTRALAPFLKPMRAIPLKHRLASLPEPSIPLSDLDAVLRSLQVQVLKAPRIDQKGGAGAAQRLLKTFVETRLKRYETDRNDPSLDATSHLSAYLHFGQISALEVALAVLKAGGKGAGAKAFLEELIVRRELALNFARFCANYDRFEGIPAWARDQLLAHERDRRDPCYSREELEAAKTHDPYWNAAQREMVLTGRMHGYMRMYWGKKLIEWSETPHEAFARAVFLNDRYELDGRDPNGYAGISWCFGTHDRPWASRKIFGSVRYMNAEGLKRKFDADAYVNRIASLDASS